MVKETSKFCGTETPGRIVSEKVPEERSELYVRFKSNPNIGFNHVRFKFKYRQVGK